MPGPWGPAIEQLRLQKRLTREVVAKRARMTPTTYGRIERGQHTQTRKLQDIADVFGVPIENVLQSRLLPADAKIDKSPSRSVTTKGDHGEAAHVLTDTTAASTIRELQVQVGVLQEQIAEIAAEREVKRRHKGRKRVSNTRVRKSGRPTHARKPR